MNRVRVVIATTLGPVEIRRITPEHPDVNSVICLENTDTQLPISAAYNSFVRSPTGIIQKLFEHGAFLLEVSNTIDTGDSWKLGVFAAHALLRAGRLAMDGDEADQVVWVTGEIRRDLSVPTVGMIHEKLKQSQHLVQECSGNGLPISIIVPEENAAQVDEARLGELGLNPDAVVPVTCANDLLVALDLPPLAAKVPAARHGPPSWRRWAAPAAAVIVTVVVAGVMLWPRPEKAPIPLWKLPPDVAMPFESNLSTGVINAMASSLDIEGTSPVTGMPFIMYLTQDGQAKVELELRNSAAVMRDTGRWWVAEKKFCYRFSRFGNGIKRCRLVFKEGEKVKFMNQAGRVLDWAFKPRGKKTALSTNVTPTLSAKELSRLLSTMNIEGRSSVSGGPFVMKLREGGKAFLELRSEDTKSWLRDQGRWWVDGKNLCFNFEIFAHGQMRCPRIINAKGKFEARRGNGTLLGWTFKPQEPD